MKQELIDKIKMPNKNENTKSIKVSSTSHFQINLLRMFISDNKTDLLLKKLIDSYVIHELTDRQQQQFNSMKEAILENEKKSTQQK